MGKRGGDKGSKKYEFFKILKNFSRNTKIDPVPIYKKLGCSLAYVGMQLRFARESGYLRYDKEGNFILGDKKIKNWEVFCADLNVKANETRARGKGRGTKKKDRIPEDFKITEENVAQVIKELFERNGSLQEIISKMKKYIIKLKDDKEKLEKALEDMVE